MRTYLPGYKKFHKKLEALDMRVWLICIPGWFRKHGAKGLYIAADIDSMVQAGLVVEPNVGWWIRCSIVRRKCHYAGVACQASMTVQIGNILEHCSVEEACIREWALHCVKLCLSALSGGQNTSSWSDGTVVGSYRNQITYVSLMMVSLSDCLMNEDRCKAGSY